MSNINFVGRIKELDKLEELYATKQFQMAVIYGRRRVGKTTLINEFCKGKKNIYFCPIAFFILNSSLLPKLAFPLQQV